MSDLRSLIDGIHLGQQPEFRFFWGHRPRKDGRISESCLSQWFDAPFDHAGERYATAEHFMMAGKARLFGDEAVRAQILRAATPAEAKHLGRQIAGYDEALWREQRFGIVVEGNRAKFEQHAPLGAFLLSTGASVLVEASPNDAIWGIGLAADHPDARNPARWPGLNLLGFALMAVRGQLGPSAG
jgi:hypothetical protein